MIPAVFSALSAEFDDMAQRLTALQDVPLLQTGAPLRSEELLRAMVALQDLDRLSQTAGALAGFSRAMAKARQGEEMPTIAAAVADMPLRSVAERLAVAIEDGS